MCMKIKYISPFDLALTIAIFELFALFWIAILGIDNMTQGILLQKVALGFLVGILTTIPALLIFKYSKLRIRFNRSQIDKIGITMFSFANGIFLAVLFAIESLLVQLKHLHLAINGLVGFTTVFLTMILLLNIYNKQPFKIVLNKPVKKFSVLRTTLFLAIVEALILPQLVFFETISRAVWWISLSGFISGFIGVYISTRIYNLYAKKFGFEITY